jgi:hypothetical protein
MLIPLKCTQCLFSGSCFQGGTPPCSQEDRRLEDTKDRSFSIREAWERDLGSDANWSEFIRMEKNRMEREKTYERMKKNYIHLYGKKSNILS